MGMFHKVQVGEKLISPIDWEMSPDHTFGTFESWGGRERVRNNSERVYYFFVDDWGEEPKLRLMERGVKHAKIMATIDAPHKLIKECVDNDGYVALFERSHAINAKIKEWLINNVLDDGDVSLVIPSKEEEVYTEDMGPQLPDADSFNYDGIKVQLSSQHVIINDDQIEGAVKKHNFFDKDLNPDGYFQNILVDNGDNLTVTDKKTGLMWQRGGLDIASLRTIQRGIVSLNKLNFAGFDDWRLPSMEEAMSLVEQEKNSKHLYLNPCFSKEQPFIFVNAQRKPGGYWFVDYKQGRAFWSSGTIPGAFARLCRKL